LWGIDGDVDATMFRSVKPDSMGTECSKLFTTELQTNRWAIQHLPFLKGGCNAGLAKDSGFVVNSQRIALGCNLASHFELAYDHSWSLMSDRATNPDPLTVDVAAAALALFKKKRIKKRDAAERVRIHAYTLSRLLHPTRSLTLADVRLLAMALDEPVDALFPHWAKGRDSAMDNIWDITQKSASAFLEAIHLHDEGAITGAMLSETFPTRVLSAELNELTARNKCLGLKSRELMAMRNTLSVRKDSAEDYRDGATGLRRVTYLPYQAAYRAIEGKGEFQGRKLATIGEFFSRLRSYHVHDNDFRILFIPDEVIPAEVALRLKVFSGTTLFGKTLSVHRRRDWKAELITAPEAIAEDVAMFRTLNEIVRDLRGTTPSRIMEQIRFFEGKLRRRRKGRSKKTRQVTGPAGLKP
jgi:hypothetical protein